MKHGGSQPFPLLLIRIEGVFHVVRSPHTCTRQVWLLVAGMWMIGSTVAAQQGSSSIRGRVADEQGGALPGVSIVVTH